MIFLDSSDLSLAKFSDFEKTKQIWMKMSNIRILFILEFQLTMFRVPSLCITDTFFNTIDSYPNIIRNLYLKILILILGSIEVRPVKNNSFSRNIILSMCHTHFYQHKNTNWAVPHSLTIPCNISFCICHNGGWRHSVFPFSTETSHLFIWTANNSVFLIRKCKLP